MADVMLYCYDLALGSFNLNNFLRQLAHKYSEAVFEPGDD